MVPKNDCPVWKSMHIWRILQTASGLLLFEVNFGQFSKCSDIDVLYITGNLPTVA